MDESGHAPEPQLDPDTEARTRALLADLDTSPDPGPMPDAVAGRIRAALAEESRLRVGRGPLARGDGPPAPAAPYEGGDLVHLAPHRTRGRTLYAVAGVAAATLVVVAGASALHLTKRPDPSAVLGDRVTSGSAASAAASGSADPHLQLSTTDYRAATLARQARALLDRPGPPVGPLAAEAPSVGPLATPVGLASCLRALGADRPAPDAVSADLATFEGRPAAVVVVTRAGASTAYVVERSCADGSPGALAGATPVP